MKKIIFSILLCSLLFMINLSEAETLDFKVVVNSANSDTVLTRDMISKIFLKKIKRWETSEEKIMPVDLVDDSSIRESFSEIILDKKISSVKAYWQKQIFSGRGVPPPEKKNDKEVLEYVDENEGAIGYVSQNAKIGKYDVTVVEIED